MCQTLFRTSVHIKLKKVDKLNCIKIYIFCSSKDSKEWKMQTQSGSSYLQLL